VGGGRSPASNGQTLHFVIVSGKWSHVKPLVPLPGKASKASRWLERAAECSRGFAVASSWMMRSPQRRSIMRESR